MQFYYQVYWSHLLNKSLNCRFLFILGQSVSVFELIYMYLNVLTGSRTTCYYYSKEETALLACLLTFLIFFFLILHFACLTKTHQTKILIHHILKITYFNLNFKNQSWKENSAYLSCGVKSVLIKGRIDWNPKLLLNTFLFCVYLIVIPLC